MADPTIISTPQVDDSTYTSAIQPALFQIQNTKFPVNSEDAIISLSSGDVGENFGFTTLDLTGSGQTFEINGYIQITTEPTLNGVYRIQAKTGDLYTIGLAYEDSFSTAEPDVQKYYNNYFNEVLVYAIKDGDVSETQIGDSSLKAIPVDNVASFNVSGLLKSELGVDYSTTRFYIEYRETYDEVISGVVQSTDNTWLIEEADNCAPLQEYHTDPSLANELDWLSTGQGSAYNAVNDSFDIASSAFGDAVRIAQDAGLDIPLDGEYKVEFTVNNPSTTTLSIRLYWAITVNPTYGVIVEIDSLTTTASLVSYSQDLNLSPYKNYDDTPAKLFIEIRDTSCDTNNSCGNLIQLEAFSIRAIGCQRLYYGIYGVNQFQNDNGFNFKGNVAGLVSTYNTANFQSSSQFFRYFPDNDLKISYLINPTLNELGANVFEEVSYYDVSGNFITSYNKIVSATTTPSEELDFKALVSEFGLPQNAYSAIVKIYYVPDNLMIANAGGTFDDCSSFDFVDVDTSSVTVCGSGVMTLTPNEGSYDNTIKLASYSSENITSQVGDIYELECVVTASGSFNPELASICMVPFKDTGGGVNLYTESDYNVDTSYTYINDGNDYVIRTTFTALDTDFNTGFGFFIPSGVQPTFAQFIIDDITVKGPRIDLTQPAVVNIDKDCRKQEIELKWYNSLGGWEYFTFTAYKDYSLSVGQGQEIKKDVYLDFVNGKAEYDYIRTEVRPRIKVRSQYLTEEEVTKIALIKESIEVQDITGDKPVVVQVDRNSVTFRKESDKLYVIEFDISYPERQTVSK